MILRQIKINHMRVTAAKKPITRQMHEEKENQGKNLPGASRKVIYIYIKYLESVLILNFFIPAS